MTISIVLKVKASLNDAGAVADLIEELSPDTEIIDVTTILNMEKAAPVENKKPVSTVVKRAPRRRVTAQLVHHVHKLILKYPTHTSQKILAVAEAKGLKLSLATVNRIRSQEIFLNEAGQVAYRKNPRK